eukprot:TRINITY_DN4454_c0_g1_i3.p3 TRINITY_DN4454_c0_g1~~TRINITY_DN4454_c0_g1_i3.p3  ORF type:complete len:130 (-),score=8.44 TRINITY_DN4454_c0_g1_i3:770-1159(-)
MQHATHNALHKQNHSQTLLRSMRLSMTLDMFDQVERVFRNKGVTDWNCSGDKISKTFSKYKARWMWHPEHGRMMQLTFLEVKPRSYFRPMTVHAGAENVLRANVAIANRALHMQARFRVHQHNCTLCRH